MTSIGKKVVFVINGQGASGKDTVCNILSKYYAVDVISAITPIKEIATYGGWDGKKDDKARKMLSDLKAVFIEYNDLPYNYAMGKIGEFAKSEKEILFIHIREKSEIIKIVENSPIKAYTLLIKRTDKGFLKREYGNKSDDCVDDYPYDFCYVGNNETKYDLESSFMSYFRNVILKKITE